MKLNELLEREKREREAERQHRRNLHVALLAALDQYGPLTINIYDYATETDDRKIYFERLPDAPETIRVIASPKP